MNPSMNRALCWLFVGLICTAILLPETKPPVWDLPPNQIDIPPGFQVEPYLQLPRPNQMTVLWETRDQLPGVVEFGPSPELGLTAEQGKTARLHEVRLDGLVPDNRYWYRVRSGKLVSPLYSFKTPPPYGWDRFRVAVYGDSRTFPVIHRKVVEQIAKANVDLIVHTGDIVVDGRNYDLWRKEFFAPLAPIAGSVPFLSAVGNHEQDSENYFSYTRRPDQWRAAHYAWDFGNARFLCLDSNDWLARDGRDKKQQQWLDEQLKAPRAAAWTFVAFHHPLFSADANRPINRLRWDWAPLFLDPASRIDGVLNGHDHLYGRCFPMARIGTEPTHGTVFLTTAGGGAPLYKVRERDYLAFTRSVHHFTLLEFDGDRVDLSAIDISGNVIDRTTLTKEPTPPEELCAYEIEELKRYLRLALEKAPAAEIRPGGPTRINQVVEVRNPFAIPLTGVLKWRPPPGWKLDALEVPFRMEPKEPLRIPLQAEVAASALNRAPILTITFDPGKFRNRIIETTPFKLTGAARVSLPRIPPVQVDGQPVEPAWARVAATPLLAPGTDLVTEPAQVQLATDGKNLLMAARLADPENKVRVLAPTGQREASKLVVMGEHVRVEVTDGKKQFTFALSPEQICYHTVDGAEKKLKWPAAAARGNRAWTAEMAIPLSLFADPKGLRVNVVYRNGDRKDAELRPTFSLGNSADVIPDWQAKPAPERFAAVAME
jgi:hypothetical protein